MDFPEVLTQYFETSDASEIANRDALLSVFANAPRSVDCLGGLAESGYKVSFADLGRDVCVHQHSEKRILLNKDRAPEELSKALIQSGIMLKYGYPFVCLSARLSGSDGQSAENKTRFENILRSVARLPHGKKLLNDLTDKKTAFAFSLNEDGATVKYDGKRDCIRINENADDAMLVKAFQKCAAEAVALAGRSERRALSDAFASKKTDDAARFDTILDTVYKAPAGKEIMDSLARLGYAFCFETLKDTVRGSCYAGSKNIVLNPVFSNDVLASTLVHEAEHALQSERLGEYDFSNLTMAETISKRRAKEADACACQALFAWQLKDVAPKVYDEARTNETMKAFISEMVLSGDERRAMGAAFKEWYGVNALWYEKKYADSLKNDAQRAIKRRDNGVFSEKCPDGMIWKACAYQGKPYIEAEFLNSREATALPDEIKRELLDEARNVAREFGTAPDLSLASAYSREALQERRKLIGQLWFSHASFEQTAYAEAFMDELAKGEDFKKHLDCLKEPFIYFERSDKRVDYLENCNALMIDPSDMVAAAADFRKQSEAIRRSALSETKNDAAFRLSFKRSPREEIKEMERVFQGCREFSDDVPALRKELAHLGYEVGFGLEKAHPSLTVVSKGSKNPYERREITLRTGAPAKELSAALLTEMKNIVFLHADEVQDADLKRKYGGTITFSEKPKPEKKSIGFQTLFRFGKKRER